MKQDPAVSYELQGTRKIRLRNYLGQRVEVTGFESPHNGAATLTR